MSNFFSKTSNNPPVLWHYSENPVPYPEAVAYMEARVQAIRAGAPEEVWLVEHPALITAGTSAKEGDLLTNPFPVYASGRGGQYTYHGPGQRIAYVMLDLNRRTQDVRGFVQALEAWMINTLAAFTIRGEIKEGRVGVWVNRPDKGAGYEDKIGAIGLRLKHWVTFHGLSLNIEPELSHYEAIVPCGIKDPRYGVTSLHALGHLVRFEEVDMVLRTEFEALFGKTALRT
jgi:lipoyl(octanoyl) transferase